MTDHDWMQGGVTPAETRGAEVTDHKTEAELGLFGWNGLANSHDHWQADVIAEAQVHATLELAAQTERLVEQQRISNLIALNRHASPLGFGTTQDLGDEVSALLADEKIRKGLGL